MGPDAMILVFWMLSLKPMFSLSSFTFIKRIQCYDLNVCTPTKFTGWNPSSRDGIRSWGHWEVVRSEVETSSMDSSLLSICYEPGRRLDTEFKSANINTEYRWWICLDLRFPDLQNCFQFKPLSPWYFCYSHQNGLKQPNGRLSQAWGWSWDVSWEEQADIHCGVGLELTTYTATQMKLPQVVRLIADSGKVDKTPSQTQHRETS